MENNFWSKILTIIRRKHIKDKWCVNKMVALEMNKSEEEMTDRILALIAEKIPARKVEGQGQVPTGIEWNDCRKETRQAFGLMENNFREILRSIICEYPPSLSADSGQPEWSQGELDKVIDLILVKIEERIPKERIINPYSSGLDDEQQIFVFKNALGFNECQEQTRQSFGLPVKNDIFKQTYEKVGD